MRAAKGKKITEKDGQSLWRFANELKLVAKLKSEGHSHGCASLQVFEKSACLEKGCKLPPNVRPSSRPTH